MLNNNSILYDQPNDVSVKLKKHQLAMLNKCLEIERNSNIGIMKDKPGAGKTYVILAMIYELKKLCKNGIETNIIIVPQNIYYQWLISIENFSGNFIFRKFIEYENILELYGDSDILKNNDIILTTSSYYYTIASTLKSLKINIKRIFIDEIDSISNLINMDINADFIMFVSASFNIENNGYFTEKIKDNNLDEITCVCEESFIDENIILEDFIKKKYICKSIFIDKILKDVISKKEMMNINAMEYKLNNKNFDRCVAKDEKDFMNILIKGNKNEILKNTDEKEDCFNRKKYYLEIKDKKDEIFNLFKNNLEKIDIIKDFKKIILKLINNFNETFIFFTEPIVDDEYEEIKDILIKKRKNIIKNLRDIFNQFVEKLYNFNFTDLKDINLEKLKSTFSDIITLINITDENIKKISKEYEKNNPSIEDLEIFFKLYIDFDKYIRNFYENINDIKSYYDCDKQIKICEESIVKLDNSIISNKKKVDLIFNRFNENNICPICYEILENKIYVTINCCNNKICGNCCEKWFKNNEKCLYCSTENIKLEDLFLIENNNKDSNENNAKDCNNYELLAEIYNFDKLTFLREFIECLKNENSKVIIFSDYNTIFSKIIDACIEFDIQYSDLDKGNIKEIEKEVINYKYGDSKILLANSTLFGCGMNLENSSHIIFVHKMDEKMEKQVIGRAQRLGRKGALNIIYLEYENEISKEIKEKTINSIDRDKASLKEIKHNENQDELLFYMNNMSNLMELVVNDNIDENEENEVQNNNNNLNSEFNENQINENQINEFSGVLNNNLYDIDNNLVDQNITLDLPYYDEVIDVNLEELISNLD